MSRVTIVVCDRCKAQCAEDQPQMSANFALTVPNVGDLENPVLRTRVSFPDLCMKCGNVAKRMEEIVHHQNPADPSKDSPHIRDMLRAKMRAV